MMNLMQIDELDDTRCWQKEVSDIHGCLWCIENCDPICDGPHTPTSGVTANDLERRTELGDPAGTKWEEEATGE